MMTWTFMSLTLMVLRFTMERNNINVRKSLDNWILMPMQEVAIPALHKKIFLGRWENAPVGHYRVSVVYYSKKDTFNSVPFTVTVYPGKGELKVFTGIVYNAKDRREIIEFDYSEKGISYKE